MCRARSLLFIILIRFCIVSSSFAHHFCNGSAIRWFSSLFLFRFHFVMRSLAVHSRSANLLASSTYWLSAYVRSFVRLFRYAIHRATLGAEKDADGSFAGTRSARLFSIYNFQFMGISLPLSLSLSVERAPFAPLYWQIEMICIVLRKFMCNIFSIGHTRYRDAPQHRRQYGFSGKVWSGKMNGAQRHASRRPCSRLWILILSHLFSHTDNLHARTHHRHRHHQPHPHTRSVYRVHLCAPCACGEMIWIYAWSRNTVSLNHVGCVGVYARFSGACVYPCLPVRACVCVSLLCNMIYGKWCWRVQTKEDEKTNEKMVRASAHGARERASARLAAAHVSCAEMLTRLVAPPPHTHSFGNAK